jgi:hypothetical protein
MGRLARLTGIAKGAAVQLKRGGKELIRRIENAALNAKLGTLGKVAAALGVHPRELLDE